MAEREWPAASPAAALTSLPLLQGLKMAAGDISRIMQLVQEAERSEDDLHTLAEVYGVAVDVYGNPETNQDNEFRDLCVKRMRALCRINPTDARDFHNWLRTYSVGKVDARMYEARAAMEERLGDNAKAMKMLQEGIRVGAQPTELLQRNLQRLQSPAPSHDLLMPSIQRGNPVHGAYLSEQLRSPLPTVYQNGLHPLSLSCISSSASNSDLSVSSRFGGTPPVTPSYPVKSTPQTPGDEAQKVASPNACNTPSTTASNSKLRGAVPRPPILGLGMPTRRLPTEGDTDDDVLDPDVEGRDEENHKPDVFAVGDTFAHSKSTATPEDTCASTAPLSPIREVDLPVDASSADSGNKRGHGHGRTAPELAPPGFTGPAPVAGSNDMPQEHDASIESSTPLLDPATNADTQRPGKVICVNRVPYTQLQHIGRGGSSKVYLVQHPGGSVLAMKRVVADSRKQLEAFQNEVMLLQQLKHHDHVIQVVDAEVDREKGRINIVMEAGDMDLGRFLQSEPRLSLAQIQHLWRQMLEAVQVIHSERIVHSDLKPGNFLLVGGRLKVIDFGIAKRIANDTTNIHRDASVGTLSYMAPEAVKQGHLKLSRASDIWSLGIILYQMVYERPPFAHLEPMQRLLALNDPSLVINLPTGHRLDHHSSTTKAQLHEVLSGCLQREAVRRPTLPELLAHPFLQTSTEVRRHELQDAISALMQSVVRAVGAALPSANVDHNHGEWQGLADEVWEHLQRSQCSPDIITGGSTAPEPFQLEGLAPLQERVRKWVEGLRPSGCKSTGRGVSPAHSDKKRLFPAPLGHANGGHDRGGASRVVCQAKPHRSCSVDVEDKENSELPPPPSRVPSRKVLAQAKCDGVKTQGRQVRCPR